MPLNFLNNGYFAGSVGIGTVSPSGKLEIASDSSLSSYITQYTDDADGAELVIRTARGTQASPVRYNTGDSAGRLLFQAYTSTGAFKDAASIESVMESGNANAYGGLRFNYLPAVSPYTLTEGIRLNMSGNVGIAQTNPGARLDVVGKSTGDVILRLQRSGIANYDFFISDAGSGGAQMFQRANTDDTGFIFQTKNADGDAVNAVTIAPSGNVGIGDTTPDFNLQVATSAVTSGSTYSWPFDLTRASSGTRGFSIGVQSGGGPVALGNHNGDIILGQTFGVDANGLPAFYETMRVKHDGTATSGKIGINDTSPDFTLDVGGTLGVSDLPFNSTSVSVLVADEITGAQLAINGDFSDGQTGWSFGAGWAVSNGGATVSTAGVTTDVRQAISYVANISAATKFRYRFEITDITAGALRLFVAKPTFTQIANVSAVGVYEYDVEVSTGSNGVFYLYSTSSGGNTFQGTVTNVSVKEITPVSNQIQKRELGTDAFISNGPYLPLTAGSSFPLTGALNINLGSTNVSTIKLRRDTTGDSQIVGDIEFDTTAAEGTDDRIALIRAETQNGDGTTRGGQIKLYTRLSGSADFNTTTYDTFGNWGLPGRLSVQGTGDSYFAGDVAIAGVTNPSAMLQIGGLSTNNTSFNVGGIYGVDYWTKSYSASNTNILSITKPNNDALEDGGAYRVTGHIPGTGTDQSSRAVFWNRNGTWYCNLTSASGTSSNSILFLVDATTGLPSVKTYHANNYGIRVWHERINLAEQTGTDNSRHYFGTDSYMSQIANDISMFTAYSGNNLNGKLGVGIAVPGARLDVANGNAAGNAALDFPVIRLTNTTASSDWDVGDKVGVLEYYTTDISGNAPYVTSFINSVNETVNGTLPSGALVFGTANGNAVTGANEKIRLSEEGSLIFRNFTTALAAPTTDYLKEMFIANVDGVGTFASNGASNGAYGSFKFITRKGDSSDPIVTMTLDSSHQVGIGIQSPNAKLQVAGGIQMADDTDNAGAAKAGTMRYRTGTEYVEVTGTELITNGDFATDTNWTKNAEWTISGGKANAANSVSYHRIVQSGVQLSNTTLYRLIFTVSNLTSGGVICVVGGTNGLGVTANGTYIQYVTSASTAGDALQIASNPTFTGSIDDVSLMEVTAEDASYADMCMQTGASTYEWVNIVRNTY